MQTIMMNENLDKSDAFALKENQKTVDANHNGE